LGYAWKVGNWSAGLAGKFIQSRIMTNAQTGAVDAGLLSPAYFDRLKLALTMTNLGGTMKYDSASERLPLAFKVGSSFKIIEHWLAALDVRSARDDRPAVGVGTEYQWVSSGPWKLSGRTGFNSRTIGSVDGLTGISFGLGLGTDRLTMDYAFVPLGEVGQANRISLTCNF
jgi:hypothetical protein